MDLESKGDTGTPPQVIKEGLLEIAKQIEKKLESLRGQYETQLDSLRTEIDRSRERRNSKEDDGSSGAGQARDLQQQYQQVKEELGESLPGEQKDKLDSLVSGMDEQYQAQLEDMHRQHVDDVDEQVKSMRSTLEEIYSSQLEIVRSEMEQSHQTAILDLQENLDKDHKEELNRQEQEWSDKLEQLKLDYETELREAKVGSTIGKEDSTEFISKLHKKLAEEHRQIIEKIEANVDKSVTHRHSQDSQTEENISVASEPVTRAEYKHAEEKQGVLLKAEDVQKSLDKQVEEISTLRAQMLGEYEQMLSVRAEVMSSQSEEVGKLQQEMAQIQRQYEDQMAEFQTKVQSQAETALKSAHEKELEEMKQYYEAKVCDMEQSYTTDIAKLKQEHSELLARLQQESGTGTDIPSPQQLSAGQHREYVRRTTTLTAISDEDETPESTPPGGNKMLEGRIQSLEEKLKDKEKLVNELKKRLEAEATSAEDLHGKLLDSNKTLDDFEDSLKSKSDEIEELKKLLTNKNERISELENEKAALEEKGEKDKSTSGVDDNKIINELKERIKKLEEDLSASKDANARIQQELNELDAQHGEAIMKLKQEMEILNKTKIAELEAGFQIQLEEELKQQADELDNKYREELSRQTTEELEIYKKTEHDLKQKLNSIQKEHENQIKELKEKYETELPGKEVHEQKIEVAEVYETQVASPTETVERDLIEAAVRKDVESKILQEYEQSIDILKHEYEERISDLNARLQSFETQDVEKAEVSDREKDVSDSEESEMREKLRAELAFEFKDKLQSVTEEYESKLKKLQDIVDSKKEMKSPGAPYALSRSRSLDLMPQKEKEKPKMPSEYEGYVSTIRREYEDKINSLQMQIAQYRSTVGSVPSSPLSTLQKSQAELAAGDSVDRTEIQTERDSGSIIPIKSELGTPELRQEIYDEIAAEFEASFKGLRTNYEKQLEELTAKLESLQSDSASQGSYENRIREEVVKEYEAKIAKLKQDYENQIAELKTEHETKVKKLTTDLEKVKSDKQAAEQKVKADMFVWHEEIVTQLKRKHEEYESQLRKEYEEKMELFREELQEGFDLEKDNIIREHKQELIDLEDRYDNLVEGLRTGEVPEVAEIVQQKFDMELEMAKTLIQQECDETIESEQTRLSEQFDIQLKEVIIERDRELDNQRVHYEKEMADLRNTLLQQYESQVIELESQHKAEIMKIKHEYETVFKQTEVEEIEEKFEKEVVTKEKSAVKVKALFESTKSEEGEQEEESENLTSLDSTSDKSEKDDDDDDKGDGKGGAKTEPKPSQSADTEDKHEQERQPDEDQTEPRDDIEDTEEEVSETMVREVKMERHAAQHVLAPKPDTSTGQLADSGAIVNQLRVELAAKIVQYESVIAQMKLSHEEEVRQLTEELTEAGAICQQKISELEESHDQEVKQYQESIQKLREGMTDVDDSEALELAHQQELQDLEERLVQKHMNELNNLETQHQSRLDDLAEKYQVEVEDLQKELTAAQRALEQYPDTISPVQTVPVFHGGSTMGSTRESTGDFMVPTGGSQTESERSESQGGAGTMETQVFEARSGEDRSEEDVSQGGSLLETLEEVGVQSLDTSVIDTSMDQSRGTLRGVDTTQDTELIQFSEEDESDKSMEEGMGTQKSDRSTPTALMQTLGYGAEIPGGPTVKSLDDTTDSSIRASDREEMAVRIKELETEVEELRRRLQVELSKQDDQMERMDREKQEESNLTAMLRGDIERLNSDRDALQSTNEHLLGLLSDAVKTYMGVEESITKKMKVMMDKSGDKSIEKGHPGSAERKKTPPPGRRSPATPPGRLSPARAEDGDNAQDTSIVSNVTDEGLDLSQHISDSIFQGPELKSEEEELLTDSGSRLRSSVTHLLDVMEETTNQLLETRQSQAQIMETLEGKGHDLEQLTSRCSDLEERLKEEVERKDFLALELHKAEGLIEGYSSERESLDERIHELEEDKETLVLELETTRNKLLDLESMQTENLQLKKEMEEQRELMTHNVGEEAQATKAGEPAKMPPSGSKALMLEVTRLNSENREKDEQIKHFHDRYESRVRELETSGDDMETHFGKMVDEKKQEVADLKLHVEALEKQLKAKKQFLEEQAAEREQEHEEYQRELESWKKTVHDLEKQNGAGSRLQREIDDLTEQLQTRIDQHNQALLDSEKYQREVRDKDLSLTELKTIIQTLEQDLQDKIQELELNKQKLKKLEEELARRSYDEDLSDSKSDIQSPKPGSSLEFEGAEDQKRERPEPQMTVEEEMRQAANKTKEELVREKFTLQSQVNENLVQISSLRNQLDDMRLQRGVGDIPDATRRLEAEREKSEEKDKEIADLKVRVEDLDEKIENREQQIEQLREQRDRGKASRGSPVEGMEFESDREMEKQMEALKRENKQLRERVKLSEASSVTDISGLSQNLLEEKNQEIDHLAEQILRLQSDYNDLKAERGVQNLCEEVEDLREELKQKEKDISDLQSVHVSAAFTDHSLTPDSSLMNVGASFSEKASIQQEMAESEASRLEKMASLETELVALRAALHNKEELIVTLQTELSTLREDVQGKDEMILALQTKPEQDLIPGMPEDVGLLQSMIQEKEELVTQLTVQVDSLQAEVDNLSDFQNKLQEDFDTVQTMLEEKDREIESLTKELTDRSPTQTDEHSLVIKHEVEIARLKKDLREKDNVVEEKLEELAELTDKVELLETHISQYKVEIKEYDEQILAKDRELKTAKKQLDVTIKDSTAALTADEKDKMITEKTVEIERLNKELETAALGRPPSPPLSQSEKSTLIKEQKEEIESLKEQVQKLLGRPPSPPLSEDEKSEKIAQLKRETLRLSTELEAVSLGRPPSPPREDGSKTDVVLRLRTEIEKLKQQIMDANLPEDEKFVLIRDLRLENETLKKQIDAALKIRPPSPPMDDDEKSEYIYEQKKEIKNLKSQLESALKIRPPSPPKSEDEKSLVILEQEKEIAKLQRQETEVVRLKAELTKVTELIENGEEKQLFKEKFQEAEKLRTELEEVKQKLESGSLSSVESVIVEKDREIKTKARELEKAEETVKKLEEELESTKEVRAYEDEIQLKEKEDEIEELQAELESYRSRTESTLAQSIDLEMSLNGETIDSKHLVKSLSFYKEQYEEKCSETRQIQVQLDLVKQQLEKARSEKLEDAQEEIELFKAELEKKSQKEVQALKIESENVVKEKEELKKELTVAKERLGQSVDERLKSVETELQLTKDELSRERMDSVQAINDLENLRERKEKERRGSLKTIQELEHDLEEKITKERELNTQIRHLNEELTVIKKQYGIEDKGFSGESRTSSKLSELKSQGSFELGTDVETLQQQVLQFKQQADKAKDILSEKQKYQSQVVKLEIQQEQLQKKMKKEVGELEEQVKSYAKQPDYDVWTQLHATQEKLEKTTVQLTTTSERLNETDSNLHRVSAELASREADMRDLQQDLWKTSGQLSVTSGKLQETEEKLRQIIGQVAEREEQIHQLQGELQHTQHEVEKASMKSKEVPEIKPAEVEKLRKQLKASQTELEAVKKSLNEAVEMSEQQLQMVENKDQEYMKLKLDIQQTLADKEKTIREQRNKLKEKEQEVTKAKQEVKEKDKEISRVKQEVPDDDALSTITNLRSQLQSQEEVILNLESDLRESQAAVEERDKDIDNIHKTHRQSKDNEADTVKAMHDQIADLQRELEELRTVTKAQGQMSRPQDYQDREQSPYDQNGRQVSGAEDSYRDQGRGRSPSQSATPGSQTFAVDDQEDSGHQSFGQQSRGPQFSPEGQSLSPRQLRPYAVQILAEEMQRQETSQVHRTPPGSHTGSVDLGQVRSSPGGSRPGSAHTGSSRGSSRRASPYTVGAQDGVTQAYSPPTRDSPRSQSSVRSDNIQSERSPVRMSPVEAQSEQRVEGQRSPDRISSEHLDQRGEGSQSSTRSSPVEHKKSSSRSSPMTGQMEQRGEGQSSSSPRRTPTFDGDGEGSDRRDQQGIPAERQTVGDSFAIDEKGQVYQTGPQSGYSENERYVGENGQLYDRDGNIRPRYSQGTESRGSQGNSRRGQSEVERAQYQEQHPSEGQESSHPYLGSQRGQEEGQGQSEGVSTEAERYIQQLRRELLITKTALMQIQRGERLDEGDVTPADLVAIETVPRPDRGQGDIGFSVQPDSLRESREKRYDTIPSEENLNRLRRNLERAEEELELFKSSSNLSARDFVQKVMNLKDELSSEHQRHIEEMTKRAHQDTETQLATMRIKYTDEIEHIKQRHGRELEEKLRDQKHKMERKHKSDTNKLTLRHQEEVGALKLRAGVDLDATSVSDRQHRQRQEGVGADHGMMNGHGAEPMSEKLQGILQRLHSEGVQVLTISELELLNRSQSQSVPRDADMESMKAGWENERQTMLSTIQSLKDLLSQTHKLRGLDKDDDDDDDDMTLEGSDWRAELLRAIGYVFTKERETLLAELRSHVLSHPSTNVDETQRLEQKIRTMESHHHAALDQIFNADRQSMLAELRDLRAHATISRMHHQEERDRLADKVTNTEDVALKKERQLKREDSDETDSEYADLPQEPEPVDFISAGVQLLEFKIQQEKVLQEDLRTSLDAERNRSGDLSGLLNQEKTSNLDLQTSVSALQTQVSKLRENLEREQSRYVSVTNALEEEKSKSLNLSDLLESERETLWRVQAELETLKQQQAYTDPRAVEQMQTELNVERDRRCQAESQHEIDMVTMENLRQEVDMGKRHQHAMETELGAKISQLQRTVDNERQKNDEINRALERERTLSAHLQQNLEAEKHNTERSTHQDQSMLEDLQIQLETERANLDDLNRALQREQKAREEADSEKNLIKDHLNQERALNEDFKHDVDKLQFERLEAVNKLQKERELVSRLKAERDQVNEDLRKVKSLEIQRDHDREAERLASKKSVRQADREKEEYRMKLHEQELETQRLSQKVCGLEDQLAESQENELKAIRELEQLRIETTHPETEEKMASIQTSPRQDFSDGTSQDFENGGRESWHVYRSQLESMCQSLHYLILRCREQLNKATHSGGRKAELADFDALQKSLRDLLSEVKQLQEMEGDYMSHPAGSVNERILRQNEELTNFVARISEEKTELRNTLSRLEEEIWRYRQMDSKYQEMQRVSSGTDHQLIAERSEWAKEKLSLQMALNSAEREIDLLQTDLRVERERRVAAGITETKDNDKIKIQRLYGKYLRAESFRKALIYQKKYLLLLLGGFQDTEETTLALLSRMGAVDSHRHSSYRRQNKPLTTFRGAVRVIIAIQRMKFLVKKWRRATRVGSEVVGGAVDQTNGYVPHSNGYSPPRPSSSPRISAIPVRSASSSPARALSYRQPSPTRATDNAMYLSPRFDVDSYSSSSYTSPRVTTISHIPSTPPTKDYSSTTKYTSPSSGARRKILTSTSIPAPRSGRVRFTSDDNKNGDLGDSDDYIHRLENLQSRLGTLQNGRRSGYRQAWR